MRIGIVQRQLKILFMTKKRGISVRTSNLKSRKVKTQIIQESRERELILINYSENNTLPLSERPIVIFDSGAGGLPYLELAISRLPGEYFYYVADTENFPYGDKETASVQDIVVNLTDRIIKKWHPKCIIVACNTASVIALSHLREKYTTVPFIGVVPAVKPAAAESARRKFGVLATPQTVQNSYLSGLIDSFAPHCDVIILPAGNLRDIVEEGYFSTSRELKIDAIHRVTKKIPLDEIDSLVLGCTHFIHLEEEFKLVLGKKIQLIDSRSGVINQLVRVLEREQLCARSRSGNNTLFVTRDDVVRIRQYRLFAEKYRICFGGQL